MINFIFRKKHEGVSIEELFHDLSNFLEERFKFKIDSYEVPHHKINIPNVLKNIRYVNKIKGILHITGDINFVAINPFKDTILTIHDVDSILKGNKLEVLVKKIFWFWMPSIFVKQITVISSFSKSQLIDVVPWAKNKITVIHNPVNTLLRATPKIFDKNNPTILHLGTKENKNLENTIRSLKNIPCTFIVVGRLNESQTHLLKDSQITFENYIKIPYADIKKLYETCDIVSFISKYEGFGMPVIEAQKVGRVVITSNRASIPEVAGNAAHFVDPEDLEAIKNGFLKIINDNEYRESLISKGFINSQRFEMKAIATQYFELYKKVSRCSIKSPM